MIQHSKSKLNSVPLGEIDYNIINSLAVAYNNNESQNENDILIENEKIPEINEADDLLDLDWSTNKQDIKKTNNVLDKNTNNIIDDDLLGVDIISDTKPVKPNVIDVDLDLFGDEEQIIKQSQPEPKTQADDLIMFDDEPTIINSTTETPVTVPSIPQNSISHDLTDNPYVFLDNIHTLETIKALSNKNDIMKNDDDEFIESDTTFSEPQKVHAFESSDLIIQYSSQRVF